MHIAPALVDAWNAAFLPLLRDHVAPAADDANRGRPAPDGRVGSSRAWLRRPEVSVRVPRSTWKTLDDHQRALLRFESVVDDDATASGESYRAFAY